MKPTVISQDTPWGEIPSLLLPAYGETWLMVAIVMLFVVTLGGLVGVVLFNASPRGLFPHALLYRLLNWVVNMGRSLPFLVLMAAIIPFTYWLTGTTIGIPAAVVPMIAAGVPFFGRLVENALRELPAEVTAVGVVCGGSRWQIIASAQLSEAMPALVAAVTLNLVSMIEYSAIAGTIGAGGIGYLAVVYGYQRFDNHIMIATIVALIATIQLIQFLGDRLVNRLRHTQGNLVLQQSNLSYVKRGAGPGWRRWLLAIAFWWWRGHTQSQQVVFGSTLKIHYEPAMAGEQRIIEYINQHIAPDYGLKLEAVGVQDPVQADRAVAEGQYAGTIYQHQWWLKQVVDANGFALSTTVPVFQWAFGIYSDRYSSVQALPNGATIVVPDDGANQGQALWLLQRIGLISLDPAVEPRTAKLKNIVGNPHQFVFKELDLLTMPRALNSVDAAIGYVSQFDAGKVPREKGILFPPAPRTFASQLVIGTPYLSQENIVKLKQAFSDPRIQTWLKTTDDPLVKDVLVPVSAE